MSSGASAQVASTSKGSRTWLVTGALSPLATLLSRSILSQTEDRIAAGIASPTATEKAIEGFAEREFLYIQFKNEVEKSDDWHRRWHEVKLDGRSKHQCQAAVAEVIATFGSIDILICCATQTLVGSVEELGVSEQTCSLSKEQFESNFYGPVNCIKAVLPAMRGAGKGHILVLSSIINHIGTPGLAATCAPGWALDAYCDTLAYEVAPFHIKLTILQPSLEVNVLTNKITAAPCRQAYQAQQNPAPLSRGILSHLVESMEARKGGSKPFITEVAESLYPKLRGDMAESILRETMAAILTIAGHSNPPTRHIVGFEGISSVKEKLKTVSEELEDFVGVSCAVDINNEHNPAQ